MTEMPKDPFMLMSWLNMKLRDCYTDLDNLCEDLDLDRNELQARMKDAGFEYSEENRRFW